MSICTKDGPRNFHQFIRICPLYFVKPVEKECDHALAASCLFEQLYSG